MKITTRLIKMFLNSFGWDIHRYWPTIYYTPDLLPILINEHILNNNDFNFVQIGANDGIHANPLRSSILKHNLNGILVEPVCDIFNDLVRNYEGQTNLNFENVAITDYCGQVSLFRLGPDCPPCSEFTKGMCTTNREKVERIARKWKFQAHIQEIKVPCITFQMLVSKYNIKNLSLLVLDTEGYDFEIIKMVFQTSLRPTIMYFEILNMNPYDYLKLQHMLVSNGYKFVSLGADMLAIT